MADEEPTLKHFRLELVRVQGDTKPEFSNNFVIQSDGAEFHIRFYQLLPPIIIADALEERVRQAEDLGGSIEAKCVAHIVFARDRMREFVKLIEEYAVPRMDDHSSVLAEEESVKEQP